MKKHHYVYHSYEEWGRDYIGVRSCDCAPENDTEYFGSFKDKTFKPTEKHILFVCKTRKEAAAIEVKLHNLFDVAVNPRFANLAKSTCTGFDRTGVVVGPPSEDTRAKISAAKTGEIRNAKTRAKMSEVQKGKKLSSETRAKMSAAHTGKILSAKTKENMSAAQKGKWEGEKHPQSKVTDAQRLQIFERYTSGEKQKDLATEFGLCRNQILKICKKIQNKLRG
jgi:hypothetical protein